MVRVNKIRRLGWAGHVVTMEEKSTLKNLTGEPTGKRLLGRPRRRWKENRMYLKEIGINTIG